MNKVILNKVKNDKNTTDIIKDDISTIGIFSKLYTGNHNRLMTAPEEKRILCPHFSIIISIALIVIILLTADISIGAISELNTWPATPQLTGTTGNLSGTFTISAGSNRLLVVAVGCYDSGGAIGHTFTATYGTRSLIQAVIENSNRRLTWIGYLKESDIAARSGDTLAITITGTHTNVSAYIASYTGVDQTTPVTGTSSIYGNNTSASYQFPAAVSINAGSYGIYTWASSATHSSNSESYTEHSDYLNGLQMGVASKYISSSGTTQPSVTYSATARVSQSIVSLNPYLNAAPTLNIDQPDGTSDTVTVGDTYNIQYDLSDSDDSVTAAFYYDSNNSGYDGTAITGACATAAEGTNATCSWNTSGMSYGTYYVYGVTNDGTNPDVKAYSSGQIIINDNRTTISGSTTVLGNQTIAVSAPYTNDSNGDNGVIIGYRLSGGGGFTTFCDFSANHYSSAYTCNITGLTPWQAYDIQIDWNDADGLTNGGSDPEVISNVTPIEKMLLHNADRFGDCTNDTYDGISQTDCENAGGTWTATIKWSGNWGLAGGQYGAFTCETCHDKNTTNIKRIKETITAPSGSFPGSSVILGSITSPNGFGNDSTAHTTSQKVCEVCHSQTTYHKYNQSGSCNHESNTDCTSCHKHYQGFRTVGHCTSCHDKSQGSRVAVMGQLSGNSHHIQGTTVTDQQCYQCHWEANSDGSINETYHQGCNTPGSAVDLVVYGTTTRPTTYTGNNVQYTASVQTRAEFAKLNTHCLSCHDADSGTAQPFGDGKTPIQYSWDGQSIDAKYSQIGTTTWGKYTAETNAAQKNITKAYSAHGNAGNNAQGWSATTGVDGTITNRTGNVNVLCFDCHNSHGSSVSGTTTSYASATTNGGILKDTTNGLGGYTATYKPADFAGSSTKVTHKAGAGLCFDCHMTATAGANIPWGYSGTFGGTGMIIGYLEKVGWEGAAGVNSSGAQQRYAYKANVAAAGGHFSASSPLNTTPNYTIGGLCTPCHDPHGVSPTLGSDMPYGVPLLKGTWLTSPYKEDAAPASSNQARGGGKNHAAQNIGSTMGYTIDQNTFRTATNATRQVFTRYNVGASGSGDRIMETATQFGGLCLNCHAKAAIDPDTNNTWGTYDRIHDSVLGWASTTGNNANNLMHGYSCSKCHTAHNSCLPRLAITNCLDVKHRGRVASGGSFSTHSFDRAGDGGGQGRGPAGGGGWGSQPTQWSNSTGGSYLWGSLGTSGSHRPAYPTCHDTATGNATDQHWNNVTQW